MLIFCFLTSILRRRQFRLEVFLSIKYEHFSTKNLNLNSPLCKGLIPFARSNPSWYVSYVGYMCKDIQVY